MRDSVEMLGEESCNRVSERDLNRFEDSKEAFYIGSKTADCQLIVFNQLYPSVCMPSSFKIASKIPLQGSQVVEY